MRAPRPQSKLISLFFSHSLFVFLLSCTPLSRPRSLFHARGRLVHFTSGSRPFRATWPQRTLGIGSASCAAREGVAGLPNARQCGLRDDLPKVLSYIFSPRGHGGPGRCGELRRHAAAERTTRAALYAWRIKAGAGLHSMSTPCPCPGRIERCWGRGVERACVQARRVVEAFASSGGGRDRGGRVTSRD